MCDVRLKFKKAEWYLEVRTSGEELGEEPPTTPFSSVERHLQSSKRWTVSLKRGRREEDPISQKGTIPNWEI